MFTYVKNHINIHCLPSEVMQLWYPHAPLKPPIFAVIYPQTLCIYIHISFLLSTAEGFSGFNPRGGAGGQMPPKDFSCPPPKHMTPSTIRLLPCQMCPPKFLELLILPPQGCMSRLNAASHTHQKETHIPMQTSVACRITNVIYKAYMCNSNRVSQSCTYTMHTSQH